CTLGWLTVWRQQINQIRRFLSNLQTPDSVITLFTQREHNNIQWKDKSGIGLLREACPILPA
ncbi:hypothetical protein, partial [Marinobacter sp.]|uniref:hypothetical protein n=1 Tax=Marinobacter sp. TaxID=50741 RepID=UPI0025BC921E